MKYFFAFFSIVSLFIFQGGRFIDECKDSVSYFIEHILENQQSKPKVSLAMNPEKFIKNLESSQQGMRRWIEMGGAVEQSIRYTRRKRMDDVAVESVTWGDIHHSLVLLKDLLPEIDKDRTVLLEHFEWIRLHTEDTPFLMTGYYHPTLRASRVPKDGYVPLYAMPNDRKRGVPYFDRRAIMNGALAGRNLEIAWAKDPFEAFLLEVQGSGCLQFDDGSKQCVRYAGQNGHKYRSSRRILEENGILQKSDIQEQREFFKEHPEYLFLLNENPSYVFFKKSNTNDAIGAMGRPLQDWQSIAVDRRVIPLGSIVALGVTLPDEKFGEIPFYALMLAQDTGGAIKRNRIDIFCGSSDRAAYVAARLDSLGPVWMLLAKDRPSKIKNVAEK